MKKLLIPLLVLTMIFSLSVCAFAESVQSPTASVVYEVTVNQPDKTNGSVSKVVNSDGTVTLAVSAEEAATFTKWVLKGDYEIVSGSLTDTTITIKPKADNVVVDTEFKTAETTTAAEETTVPSDAPADDNGSGTSPETGAPVAAVAVTLAVALGAAFVAKKQLSK